MVTRPGQTIFMLKARIKQRSFVRRQLLIIFYENYLITFEGQNPLMLGTVKYNSKKKGEWGV
jgi:hypothetical protein